jgi:alpha-1,2-mannosyltransferase
MASTDTNRAGPGEPSQWADPGDAAEQPDQARGWRARARGWLARPWAVWPVTAAAWAGTITLIWYLANLALTRRSLHLLSDLHVYRNGGRAIVHGTALYSMVTDGKLLFTYPPLSAVLAVPMTWVSWHQAQGAWMLMIYLPLLLVAWYAFRPMLTRAGRYAPAVFAVLVAGCALLAPMRQEVHYGQVDILLVALCAADCLARRTWWPRGALIGLAAAIKLVPGVFIVYLLITGRRKAAVVAAGSFAAWTGLAWLIAPSDSAVYWTSAVFSSRRLGPNVPVANQSLRGLLLRAFFPGPLPTALWIGIALVVAAAGFFAARRVWQRGYAVGGVAITGLLAALLSPVAWIHHYCWIILAVGAIAGDCRSERRVITAIAAGGLFMSAMPSFGGYLHVTGAIPALPAVLIGDSFGLAALALIWVMFRISVTDADRWPVLPAPAAAGQSDPAGRPRVPASRASG